MITKLWHDNKCYGKERRIYYFKNQDSFHEINTEEKAYWLGFLMADGSVSEGINKKSPTIRVSLQESDELHLVKFKNFLETNKPIVHGINTTNGFPYAGIEVSSKMMFQDLVKLGCTPKKTYKNTWVELKDDNLQFAFIRGYFDGDGSISKHFEVNELHKVNITICGSCDTLEFFRIFLNKNGINSKIIKDNREYNIGGTGFGNLVIINKANKNLFLEKIYPDDCKIYLERKFELAKRYKELFKLNPRTWTLKEKNKNADIKLGKIGEVNQDDIDNTEVSSEIAKGSETP